MQVSGLAYNTKLPLPRGYNLLAQVRPWPWDRSHDLRTLPFTQRSNSLCSVTCQAPLGLQAPSILHRSFRCSIHLSHCNVKTSGSAGTRGRTHPPLCHFPKPHPYQHRPHPPVRVPLCLLHPEGRIPVAVTNSNGWNSFLNLLCGCLHAPLGADLTPGPGNLMALRD